MKNDFEMMNSSLMHYFLDSKVIQLNDDIFMSQEKYTIDSHDKPKIKIY